MSIRTQTPPQLSGYPTVNVDGDAFSALIHNKGYNVLHEEARLCPCVSRESGSPLLDCQNCRGYGKFFINPIETKAVVTNINQNPKYMEWSEENAGTIYATLSHVNRLADFDRVTFLDVIARWTDSLRVRTVVDQMFVFLTYLPDSIIDIFYFSSSETPLVKLTTSEYSLDATNPYVVKLNFTPPTDFNGTIVVTYNCHPSYHVVDTPHLLRASTWLNSTGQLEKVELPIQAVLRRSHLVLTKSDYEGGVQTIDNSYL